MTWVQARGKLRSKCEGDVGFKILDASYQEDLTLK